MSKIRIGLFSDIYYPENVAVAIRMHHITKALYDSDKFNISIHTSTKLKKYKFARIINNFIKAPSNKQGNLSRLLTELLLGTELFFKVLFSNYNIAIVTSPPFFISFLVTTALKFKGIRYVLDVRDYYPEVFFSSNVIKKNSLAGKMFLSMEKHMYKNAMIITTVTSGIFDSIITKHTFSKDKLYLLRNGFDQELFKPSSIKRNKFTIVFHGNLGKFQDTELIMKLINLCEQRSLDIDFFIIGDGSNSDIFKSHKHSNLHYLGDKKHSEIPDLINSAHLGISFRTNDIISKTSFPVKIYEYIGVCLPVVVTPISEAGNFVEKNKLGLQFDYGSINEIFKAVECFYQNPNKLDEFSANCLKYRSKFARQNLSNNFVRYLNDISDKNL